MENCLAHGEVWAPCRWTGAMQMLERAPCRWAGAMLVLKTPRAVGSSWGCDFRIQQPPQIADPLWLRNANGTGRVQVAKGSITMQSRNF